MVLVFKLTQCASYSACSHCWPWKHSHPSFINYTIFTVGLMFAFFFFDKSYLYNYILSLCLILLLIYNFQTLILFRTKGIESPCCTLLVTLIELLSSLSSGYRTKMWKTGTPQPSSLMAVIALLVILMCFSHFLNVCSFSMVSHDSSTFYPPILSDS